MGYGKHASELKEFGATVVPAFTDNESYGRWQKAVWAAMDDFPEFKLKGKDVQRVLGGFGALANPSSFHHPTIQRLRTELKQRISIPLFQRYAHRPDLNIEVLFDRLCVRFVEFGTVSKESWHRDIYDFKEYGLRPLPQGDELFGGWVNLSEEDQKFRGLLGSHKDPAAKAAQERGGGFALLTDEEISQQNVAARLRAQSRKDYGSFDCNHEGDVVVPPGHMIVFYQRLVHAIPPSKPPNEPQLRLFFGHRLTLDEAPLYPLQPVIVNNEVPRIPSGQVPPMYSKNHYAFFSTTPKYRDWGTKTFKKQCLYERVTPKGIAYETPGSRKNLIREANLNRSMPSLAVMGFDVYPYSEANRRTMTPETLDFYGPETDVIDASDE